MTGAHPVHTAIAEAQFRFARQRDDPLPPRGIVPIAEMAGLAAAKDNPFRCHQRGEFGMGSEGHIFDV